MNLCATIANKNTILTQHLIEEQNQYVRGGSVPGHITINRDCEVVDGNLFNDYFAPSPRFTDTMFHRCFRMGRDLFLRIFNANCHHDNYFVQKRDSYGKLGLSGLLKTTVVFQMLAYGLPIDATNEYIKIEESIAVKSLKRFCRAVVDVFGRYACCSGTPTIILEAIADYDLWIWHAIFGLPGSNNDINTLEASHLFSNLAPGGELPAPDVEMLVDENLRYGQFLSRHRQIKNKDAHTEL